MAKNQTIKVTAQCAYEGANGRCKRKTTITHPYCAEHTREVLGVEVKASQIPGAGLGLWAVRDFKKGQMLFNYGGERLSVREYNERYDKEEMGAYGITLNSRFVLDARATDAGVARYVCSYQGSGKKPNMEYVTDGKVVEMWTIRSIKAGEELFSDYGTEMLTAMGVLPKETKPAKQSKK